MKAKEKFPAGPEELVAGYVKFWKLVEDLLEGDMLIVHTFVLLVTFDAQNR